MFDFFIGFFRIIESLVRFLINFFSDVVYMVRSLGSLVAKIPSMLGFLPSAVVSVFLSALAIVVLYKVIGRD